MPTVPVPVTTKFAPVLHVTVPVRDKFPVTLAAAQVFVPLLENVSDEYVTTLQVCVVPL